MPNSPPALSVILKARLLRVIERLCAGCACSGGTPLPLRRGKEAATECRRYRPGNPVNKHAPLKMTDKAGLAWLIERLFLRLSVK